MPGDEEKTRYDRSVKVNGIGEDGQKRFAESSVLIVGVGGLGSPNALYLAASGVGRIGLCDSDNVELSNLQRQVIHSTPDIGKPKVDSAREKVMAINPGTVVDCYQQQLNTFNAEKIIKDYDILLDCTDSIPAKFLLNDAAVMLNKVFIYAGVQELMGQFMTVVPQKSACLRCLFPNQPRQDEIVSTKERGILGPVAGLIGIWQSISALQVILGNSTNIGDLTSVEPFKRKVNTFQVKRDINCPVCGENPAIQSLKEECYSI